MQRYEKLSFVRIVLLEHNDFLLPFYLTRRSSLEGIYVRYLAAYNCLLVANVENLATSALVSEQRMMPMVGLQFQIQQTLPAEFVYP